MLERGKQLLGTYGLAQSRSVFTTIWAAGCLTVARQPNRHEDSPDRTEQELGGFFEVELLGRYSGE
jgi:hypothetical protein